MSSPPPDPRIENILEVLLACARQDFGQRAPISDHLDSIDALAAGINMLAEELDGEVASRRELEAAYLELQRTQARLLQSGKLAAIGQLSSGIAHEINNPASWVLLSLTRLSRFHAELRRFLSGPQTSTEELESLRRSLDDSDVALQSAQEGLERIATVTRDLRIFSRADDDSIEELSLADLVRSACRLAGPTLHGTLQLELALCEVPRVRGNRGKLGQVITNLLVNAMQALTTFPEDSRRVRVNTRISDEGCALIAVDDSGAGVPEPLRTRIFEPYFTTKCPDQGMGLGLAIVADIVQGHGGTVRVVESELGGARFEVRLPAISERAEAVG